MANPPRFSLLVVCLALPCSILACGGNGGGGASSRSATRTPGVSAPLHIGIGYFDRILSTSDDGRWALATSEPSPSSVTLFLVDTTHVVSEVSGPTMLGSEPDPMGHNWITRDGKYAIYTINATCVAELHVDATSPHTSLFKATNVDLGSVLLSNDQQWVAFTQAGALSLLHVGNGNAKSLTSTPAFLAAFSPGSHYLAWVGSAAPLHVYALASGQASTAGEEVDVFQFTPDDATVVGKFGSDLITLAPTGAGSMGTGTVIAHDCENFWLSPDGRSVLFQQLSSTMTTQTLSVIPVAGGATVAVGPSQPAGAGITPAYGFFTPDESGVVTLVPSSTQANVAALYVASAASGNPTMVQPAVSANLVLGAKGDVLFRGDIPASASDDSAPAPLYLVHADPPSTPIKVGDDVGPAGVFPTTNLFSIAYGPEMTPDGADLLFIGGTGTNLFSTTGSLGAPAMRDGACGSGPCDSPYYASYAPDGSYIYYLASPSPGGVPGTLTLLGRDAGMPVMVSAGVRSAFAATPHGDVLLYAIHSLDPATGGLWRVDIGS